MNQIIHFSMNYQYFAIDILDSFKIIKSFFNQMTQNGYVLFNNLGNGSEGRK